MKRLHLITLLLCLTLTGAIGQNLTIEQAVTHSGFFADSPRMIWGGPAGSYLQVRNDELIATQARSGKETVLLTREALNRAFGESGVEPVGRLSLPQVMTGG